MPWTIDDGNDACFIVRDANGQALGYFYFENEAGTASNGREPADQETKRGAWRRTSRSFRICCGGRLKLQSVLGLSIPLIWRYVAGWRPPPMKHALD